jgi:hypothetical protein
VPPLSALKTPLRDGDSERPDDEAYAGSYFVNANSGTVSGIVDTNRDPIEGRSKDAAACMVALPRASTPLTRAAIAASPADLTICKRCAGG